MSRKVPASRKVRASRKVLASRKVGASKRVPASEKRQAVICPCCTSFIPYVEGMKSCDIRCPKCGCIFMI